MHDIQTVKIFPEQSLLSGEFQQIKEIIAEQCVSPMAKEAVIQLQPASEKQNIMGALHCASEMISIIEEELPFPTTGYIDTRKLLRTLRIMNSVLSTSELIDLLQLLETSGSILLFFKKHTGRFKHLEKIITDIPYKKEPAKLITDIIDEQGVVRNNASPELARVRKTLQRTRTEAARLYQAAISKLKKQGWVADNEESSRNGRRVIAVVAEQKRTVKGIVHDISATGKTVFIEPFDTIDINNRVGDLEQQEKMEIDRILRALTSDLRPFSEHFQHLHHVLEQMDLNLGKAWYSRRTGSTIPAVRDEPYLELKGAVHPLLSIQNRQSGKKTIPFDLILDRDSRILVISGPNAGGKTVCMKSIGLLQLMVQAGIPVTTDTDSVFGIFNTVLVDIGDSQSIEYELSTYSSRLKLMKMFLENAGERTLFLIDEFGTGTDPSLGGALAESVLNALNEQHAFGVITTHYLNLKVMADKTDGIINGSMEFDLKHLKPLFRLVTGKPGSSYTFIVAERSGLPREVIKYARKKVPRKTMGLEKLLSRMESDKSSLTKLRAEAELRESQLNELIAKYEKLSEQTKKEGQTKSDKLKRSEARLKKEYEDRFKDFLKEWRKAKSKKEVVDKYYRQFVKSKNSRSEKADKKRTEERIKFMKENLKPGMTVKLINGHTKGIVEKVGQKSAYVQFGEFRTKCDLSTLEFPESE
mgnify:CR=1 FL=1